MRLGIVDLPEIAIIGREGFCTKENNVVSTLWEQANAHFDEVAELGMREKDGSYVGFWGAMSDETMSFLPWTENYTRGFYLAGIEVYPNVAAPESWKKWVLPARKYYAVEVSPDSYAEIFWQTLHHTLPQMKLALCGAVCDYTEPATGKSGLFFPVRSL